MTKIRVIGILIVLFGMFASQQPSRADGEWTTMHGLNCAAIDKALASQGGEKTWIPSQNMEAFSRRILALAGPNLWLSRYGWNIPGYSRGQGSWEAEIDLYACGHEYFLFIYRANLVSHYRYVFLFNSMAWNCDQNGEHCGNHDFVFYQSRGKRLAMTFAIPTWKVNVLFQLAQP